MSAVKRSSFVGLALLVLAWLAPRRAVADGPTLAVGDTGTATCVTAPDLADALRLASTLREAETPAPSDRNALGLRSYTRKSMRFTKASVWAFIACAGLKATAACGGDSFSAAGGQCPELSGAWSISGDCPPSSCNFDQSGCHIAAECNGGLTASGALNGSELTFSGDGVHCTATVSLGTGGASAVASGTCQTPSGKCSFRASCASGACTRANEPEPNDGGQTSTSNPPAKSCQMRVASGSHQECDYSVCAEISDSAACCSSVTDYRTVTGTMCPSGCTDLQTDAGNCGGCGKACSSGQSCVAGSCVVVQRDGGIHGGGAGGPGSAGASSTGGSSGVGGIANGGGAPGAGGTTGGVVDAGVAGGSSSGGGGRGGGPVGTGGLAGATSSCHPPTTDGQCELVSRCGCASSQNCAYVGSATKCIAPGGVKLWSACTYNSDCPAGAGCTGGVCRPDCDTAADCGAPGSQYRACYQVVDIATSKPFPGFKACTQQCNPMDPTNTAADPAFGACGDHANCIVSSLGVSGTTNCVAAGSGAAGETCASTSDCSGGLICARGISGANVCSQWCRVGHDEEDCPSASCDSGSGSSTIYGTCNALSSSSVGTRSGVVPYGYCTLDVSGC